MLDTCKVRTKGTGQKADEEKIIMSERHRESRESISLGDYWGQNNPKAGPSNNNPPRGRANTLLTKTKAVNRETETPRG